MKGIAFLLLSGLVTFLGTQGLHTLGTEKWTHQVLLDEDNGVEAKWRNFVDEENETWILMEIGANTRGYVGVGWSPKGGMINGDMAIGWVDDSGAHLHDFYGIENGTPKLDDKQDYELVSAEEKGRRTTITFKRKWDTCDDQDEILQKDTMHLIWSFGTKDPVIPSIESQTMELPYHGMSRGTQSVFLADDAMAFDFPNEQEDLDLKIWDMTMKDVRVSAVNTTYHCRIEKFTDTSRKHHLIGWKPIIQKENIKNVHHILFYECHVPEEKMAIFDHYAENHPGDTCYTKTMPPEWGKSCTAFLLVWTVGAIGEMLPAHVGAPLGQEHGGGTYFMIEMHYENPEGRTFLDNSGIRVYYTDKLRENEGGVLLLGYRHSPFLLIPPKQDLFKINGVCAEECLEKTLPPTGINIVTTFIHAHLWGKNMRLRHFRKGVELPLICEDNNYDFNYQQSKMLKKEVKILPGDELLTECEYVTKDMNRVVLGGLATNQEMCQTFLFYYPRIEIGQCTSQSEFHDFMRGLGVKEVTGEVLKALHMPYDPKGAKFDPADNAKELEETGEGESYRSVFDKMYVDKTGSSVGEYLRNAKWEDKGTAKGVEKAWETGKHYQFCTAGGSRRIPLNNHIVSYPTITKPLNHTRVRKCSNLRSAYSASTELRSSMLSTFIASLGALLFFCSSSSNGI